MAETPTLYVCDGDEGGPKVHPCRRVQAALKNASVDYEKVIAGHGSPWPFLRGPREPVVEATGDDKLPAMVLADGTVLKNSRAILRWVREQS